MGMQGLMRPVGKSSPVPGDIGLQIVTLPN